MKTRKILALVLALVMLFSLCATAFADSLTEEPTEREIRNSEFSKNMAAQGYILLKNNGVLPLDQEANGSVALYGSAIKYLVAGGSGSGSVNTRSGARDTIPSAFENAGWTITDADYVASIKSSRVSNDSAIPDEALAAGLATDTAIYAIARNAGEGSDRQPDSGNGAFNLTAIEKANLTAIAEAFENVIVVLNTCVVDTTFINSIENVDAIVYMSNGGVRSGEALEEIISGKVTPSGKLTDTFPVSYLDYPSTEGFANRDGNTMTEYYNDGIYVGYRYFDTFGLDVNYPFGYGLSYTDFDIDVVNVSIDASEVCVEAAVTNVGTKYSGKEVVEVYFSAPDGTLEKPYQELAAYAKTDELQPGETQILTIKFDTTDMSSYSEARAAYIMERGNYIIRVGNSSRNTHVAAVGTLARTVVTEQLSNQLALEDASKLEEISKAGATPITYEGEAAEIAAAKKIAITGIETVNNASQNDEETVTTYLFAEDAENYIARENITLQTKTVAGVIRNAENPEGPRYNGHSTTTYKEVVEIVPPLPEGITKETAKLTDVLEGKITYEQLVACLSVDEMSHLVVGSNRGGYYFGITGYTGVTTPDYMDTRHIPPVTNTDGPAGVRISTSYKNSIDGQTHYRYLTYFPAGTCVAQTWDKDLIYAEGIAIGSEMKDVGSSTWLAPGMNIHRNALCGRNFEYYSEDPLVTGITAAYVTLGVQSHSGIGVTLKHFWGNSQESARKTENNVLSERAAREIYMKGFEIAVKLAQPQAIMNSYNLNNGWHSADDWDTNEDITRNEWGYQGIIMTDWNSTSSTEYIAKHGGDDLVMPGNANAALINKNVGVKEPTFNEDGTILDAGDFGPQADGSVYYVTPTNAPSENDLPEVLTAAIAAREARYDKIGEDATITWYGEYTGINKIALGDLQKAAKRILRYTLESDKMELLVAEKLGKEYVAGSVSELHGARLLDEDYTPFEKSEPVKMGIRADKVTVDAINEKTAQVPVKYEGEEVLTTVRLYIDSALPIDSIESVNDFEYNPADGRIIIYKGDGEAISNDLFTINYKFDELPADGEYPVDLTLIEVTGADALPTSAVAIDGAVIIDNNYPKGDVSQDGEMTNSDLIMIARYLVGLVEFNAKQMIAADFNEDGIVNNTDLVLIARALVAA